MKCLGTNNNPTAEVHPGHMLTGPKEEEEQEQETGDLDSAFDIANH
jgi:hypothetical protein